MSPLQSKYMNQTEWNGLLPSCRAAEPEPETEGEAATGTRPWSPPYLTPRALWTHLTPPQKWSPMLFLNESGLFIEHLWATYFLQNRCLEVNSSRDHVWLTPCMYFPLSVRGLCVLYLTNALLWKVLQMYLVDVDSAPTILKSEAGNASWLFVFQPVLTEPWMAHALWEKSWVLPTKPRVTCSSQPFGHGHLNQRSACMFSKRPDNKTVGLSERRSLCPGHVSPSVWRESRPRHPVSGWAWPCSGEIVLVGTDTSVRPFSLGSWLRSPSLQVPDTKSWRMIYLLFVLVNVYSRFEVILEYHSHSLASLCSSL